MHLRARTWLFLGVIVALLLGTIVVVTFTKVREEPHQIVMEFAGVTNRPRQQVQNALFLVSNRTAVNVTFDYAIEVQKKNMWTNGPKTHSRVMQRSIGAGQSRLIPIQHPPDGITWRVQVTYTKPYTVFESLRFRWATALVRRGWRTPGRLLMPRRTSRHFVTPSLQIDDIFFPERRLRRGSTIA